VTRARPAAGGGRILGVAPERLGRWLDGVAERHGSFTEVTADDDAVRITSADTTTVVLRPPFAWTPGAPLLGTFAAAARQPHRAAVLLVRRGRWAVGVFDGPDLVVSKVDARQVQGRTAAGGWSQQRFARRRENQARAAAGEAADLAARVLLPAAGTLAALVCGGDRRTVDTILTDRRLAPLAALRAERHLQVPDPRHAVLLDAARAARAVSIHLPPPLAAAT
jgi:Actinobacteria/chloroflexi VLRF1 release factor